jgi:hypothetical protein
MTITGHRVYPWLCFCADRGRACYLASQTFAIRLAFQLLPYVRR